MSLNWNAQDVKGWKELGSGLKDIMIFGLMFIGMQKITAENLDEVQARVALHQRLFGDWMVETTEEKGKVSRREIPLGAEDVKKFVGLTTNVSTETRGQFNKRVMKRFYEDQAVKKGGE